MMVATDRQIDGVVDALFRDALAYCRGRLGTRADPVVLLRRNDPAAHDYFRYGLAHHLAPYLGAAAPLVNAVYVGTWDEVGAEGEIEPPGLTSPLRLLVLTEMKHPALVDLLARLDRLMTQAYQHLVAPVADRLQYLLDVHLIDDGDVCAAEGAAVLLDSVQQRPLRVWSRMP